MAESTPQKTPESVQASLHQLAQVLRGTNRLTPEAQAALADLVDELSQAVQPGCAPEAAGHVADSATNLAQALKSRQNPGVIAAAKERLAEAAVRLEAEAPLATGFAERFLDLLANLGI